MTIINRPLSSNHMSETLRTFTHSQNDSERLDKFLTERLPELSRSRVQGLIKDGFVRVDEKPVSKTGFAVTSGMSVSVILPPPEPVYLIPEEIPLDIVFENDDLILINKPAGMVVHPSAGHSAGTLVHAALAHAPEMEGVGGEIRPGIVHRLDKDTSGLILVAKNDRAHQWLQDQFRLRKVNKVYLALVDGKPPTPEGRIEAAIARDPSHRKKMAVVPENRGRAASTEYRTLESFPEHTLIEAHPFTGRTHQIRLHLAFIGCPIAADLVYGHRKASVDLDRHFLHAARITLVLPGEKAPRTFEAPLPPDLENVLTELRTRRER
jgi:23S rRNA pseudouridine1911/1915/1917 synthase